MRNFRSEQPGLQRHVWICLWVISLLASRATAADEAPAAPAIARVSWDTSRVRGSPEPPLPYKTERVFAELALKRPLYAAMLPGTDRLLVVEQSGHIVSVPNVADAKESQEFLKLANHDTYSFCFHPRFATNNFVYIFANGPNSEKRKQNRILRYEVSAAEPRACRLETETSIIEWDSNGHNGGEMAFGPDGLLYISSGDGTSDSDTNMTGQDLHDLNSGVLRIDLEHPAEGKRYGIPRDNPFLQIPDARPELWAYGFRNPWRLCFDARTGDLWVGDIGQDLWEMVHVVQRGANHGWSVHEGGQPFYPLRPRGPTPISPPTIQHHHTEARSITGGVVYYGAKFPDLVGAYLYGDYSTGKIWGARYREGKITWQRELADTTLQILAFAQDPAGEVLIIDYTGEIHRLIEAPPPTGPRPEFPRKLSETGLFVSVAEHRLHPAIVSYNVNSPLWSDGAAKLRFIALPGLETMQFTEKGAWKFPEGTVLVKTFSLDIKTGEAVKQQHIETRLITLQQNEWIGYTYRWNNEQTDAVLVGARGEDGDFSVADAAAPGGMLKLSWHFPSRTECMVCHSRAAGFVLGPQTAQMNRDHDYGALAGNQLAVLSRSGYLQFGGKKKDAPKSDPNWALPKRPEEYPRLADPYDATAGLAERVHSYLHANCAQCHVPAGGGNSAFDVKYDTPDDKQRLIGVAPLHDKFGIADALLIAPGEPDRSMVLYRMAKTSRGRMPPLATSRVDQQAVELIQAWIRQLPPAKTPAPSP